MNNPVLQRIYDSIALRLYAACKSWAGEMSRDRLILDVENGTVKDTSGKTWPIEIIGTYSKLSHSWRWAWANDDSSVPSGVTSASRKMHDLGTKMQLAELVDESLDIDLEGATQLAMIATGVSGCHALYPAEHSAGFVFLASRVPILDENARSPDLRQAATRIAEGLAELPIASHEVAVEGLFAETDVAVLRNDNILTAANPRGESLTIEFDHVGGRIVKVSFQSAGSATLS
ncbi:MAG: hypothetical protein JNM18_02845 [Planctomycetaceae bacterium]|nr:hypothetical protein [Planctomycetaceae bacterium]